MELDAKDYIEKRLEDQAAWYDKAAKRAQRLYYALAIGATVFAGAVPIAVAFEESGVGAVLGGMASIATASLAILKSQESWVRYRSTWNALHSERFRFETGTGPYREREEHAARGELVRRVEGILKGEYAEWQQASRESGDGEGG